MVNRIYNLIRFIIQVLKLLIRGSVAIWFCTFPKTVKITWGFFYGKEARKHHQIFESMDRTFATLNGYNDFKNISKKQDHATI
jgi:hypothetical protein